MKKNVFLLSFITLAFAASAQITSTFDTDADGWTFLNSATPITPNHSTTGGNPAGFISVVYSASVGTSTQSWIAPAKYLGSQVMRSMDMNLRFDLQQSQAGTNSNANGDVRIESSSIRLVYSLPVKPAVAPGWSSYSLKLDETQGWRLNNTTGAFATRTQIIAVLSNITAIEIRGTYATNATYTSGIDNVILEQRTLPPPPTIASFTPTSGEPGAVLTITGTDFDTTPANNAVYFGSIAGTITSASATQLSVTIPIGASHGPMTVINKTTGASKRSEKPFNPTFTEGGRIIPASFKPRFDILLDPTAGNNLNGLATADLDGDGWNDLLVTESSINTVSIFRNLGLGGDLSISSFGSKLSLTGAGNRSGVFTVDLDGDGKLDVVTAYVSSPFEYFATYRNVSTPGNLSFESVELWQAVAGNSSVSAVVDIDGDGRPDLIGQTSTGSVSADFWITQNISNPGNIEFGASIAYFGGSTLDAGAGVSSGDLDNDGKPDLIVQHSFGSLFSIIKNNSTPGSISLGTPIAFAFGSYGDINISDFNGDGKNDIAWKDGSSNNDVRIRINTNSGGALAATDFATEVILDSELTNYGGLSVADVNGDGKPDIIATDAADVGVFENNYTTGVFDANAFVSAFQLQGYSAATYPFSPVVVDLNGDKKPELILGYTNSSPRRISIFENKNVPAPVISLNTVSPLSAPVGSTVTITGNNFSTVLTDNEVWFGDVRATVLTASATQLTVTVPAGAAYAPVNVRKGELSSSYHLPFSTSFSSGVTFNATHFAPPITYTLAGADYDIEVGDLDLDGKPDVIADGTGQIPRLFQNTHASGAISGTSLTSAGAVANSAANAKLVDVDGDGKLDIVGGSGRTFPNQSTVGSILFGTEINAISGDNVTFGDLNQDGKTDLASAAFSSGSAQLILQENRSNVGTFVSSGAFGTFSTSIVYTKASRGGDVTIADFDNDGFNDVVSLNPFTDNISVFRNAQRLRVSATTFDPRVEIAVGDNPLRSYPADFDRDGKIDLLVTHWTGTSTTLLIVFQNTSTVGTISFNRIDITNPSTVTIATVADLDGDGKPEILTTSEAGNRFSIFKNLHTSGALTAASFAAPFNTTVTAPRGITTGDLNLDGKPEIIITRAAGLLVVYENLITSIPIVPPTITSFTPTSGPAGSSITITGTDFDALAINNIVYFGAVKAVVTAATSTQLTVTVPSGAGYGRINILNKTNGRASLSPKAFTPTFDGGGRIIPASFKPKFDIPTILIESVSAADVDGDGWIDLAVTNDFTDRVIDIYRNLGAGGTLAPASFATKVSIGYSGVSSNGTGLWFADLDGDGKPDAITSTATVGFVGVYVTFRNTSTPGNISFEAPEYWNGGTDETPIALVSDLDGDGRPDFVSGEGAIPGAMWFNQNISSPGNIEIGPVVGPVGLAVVNGFSGATAGDLNGDGKPELVVSNAQGGAIDILQNTSTPGAPTFTEAFQIAVSHRSIFIVDMNLDGKNDLIYKSGVGFRIRLNNDTDGTLTAADFPTEIIITGDLGGTGDISIGDINGDGKPDILDRDDFEVGVYENIYSGGAFDATAFIPTHQYRGEQNTAVRSGPLVADLNGDGKPEMIVGVRTTVVNKISIYENKNVHAPIIAVNTVSPLAAPIGATVTITGDFFSTIPAQNIVRFGAVRATVLTATKTQLTVSVPPGAAYAPVSVTKDGLSSSYRLPFKTTFGPGVTFDNTHFAPPVNYTLTTADYNIAVGDLNNDGKPDVVAEAGNPLSFTSKGYAFRNEFTSGAITTSTLVANDTLGPANFIDPTIQDFDGDGYLDVMNGNSGVKRNTTTGADINFSASVSYSTDGILSYGDFNSDGKVDVVATNATIAMQILENRLADNTFVTTPLSSFSTVINFTRPSGNGGAVVAGDFDGDGFDDAITTNSNVDNISIFRNLGLGRITTAQFATRVDIAVGDIPSRIYSGDFDADGKLDLLFQYGTGTNPTMLTIMHNTSTAGNISFTRIDLTNPSNPTLSTIADLDGDGKPEIITTSEAGNRFSIFKNTHTSGALTAASFAAPFNTSVTAPRGITTADLNLDGKPEIILTRAAGLLVVYENLVSVTQNFITQWNLATAGSGPTQLTLGTATSGNVNYAWQEISPGTASGGGSWSGATLTLTGLPTGATIRLQIAPTNFQRIINSGTDRNRLTQVEQWGSTAWASMQGAFSNCTNLQVTATDVPNLSGVTDMSGMFAGCTVLNSPSNINTWNTSNVSNMATTFNGARAFNQDIGAWNTAAVTNMQGMFFQATAFNQNISTWNTAAVTNMQSMFFQATAFNQNIGAWNTSAVTSMRGMFEEAIAFNQNIGSWNTAAVTTMKDMFQGAVVFNQDISSWNTAAVTVMEFMFNGASVFNQNIGAWNTGAVIDMERMFLNASAFNQNISAWNTATAIDMRNMFANATAFNQNIGSWTLNPAVTMTNMFDNNGMDCNNYSATLIGWSANPSTPNSRTLGATGRQYGTNALVARTNLVSTKLWAITGDTPSGTVCSSVSVPTITNFTPTSGPVGTMVTITGTNFSTTPVNNTVLFNGTTSVVTASTTTSITTTVPVGATTGLISVTVNGNTAVSATTFTVTASPVITITTQPSDFIACVGQTASFTTEASGTTNIIYRWQFSIDGVAPFTDINNGGGYSGATTATLTVNTTGNFGLGRYRCRINGDFADEVITNDEGLFINPIPTAPTASNISRCGPGSVTLTVTGGSNGQYRWYTTATGGTAISGEVNSIYFTPSLTTTTPYFVSINDGCESPRTSVIATVNSLPATPTITSNITLTANAVTICSTTALTLTAPNGFASYNWSNGATTSQINVSTSGSYSVTITDAAGCSSPASTAIAVTVVPVPCSNSAPVINTTTSSTTIGGQTSINLLDLISDPDDNLIISSLIVFQQPGSGAVATITNGVLTINYDGISFTGKDQLTIRVCDVFNECTQQLIEIDVIGEIEIYNGLSPNEDNLNPVFLIRYIDLIPETQNNKVTIFNRWGSKVFEVENYNNSTNVFRGLNENGNELPSGTYFYKILFSSGRESETGYLTLKR